MTDASSPRIIPHTSAQDSRNGDARATSPSRTTAEVSHATDRGHTRHTDRMTSSVTDRIGGIARWALAVAACLWLAWCTAVGPLYWADSSIARFGWVNAGYGIAAFVIYLIIIVSLVRKAKRQPLLGYSTDPDGTRSPRRLLPRMRHRNGIGTITAGDAVKADTADANPSAPETPGRSEAGRNNSANHHRLTSIVRIIGIAWQRTRTAAGLIRAFLGRWIVRATDRRWKLTAILLIGWLWAPTTLFAAFGADLRSQAREFSWAWNQWTGLKQPYIGFFSFAPMDIYPTAHYMWPEDPTYLTDQHNIVLTLFYGATLAASRYLTGSNDWGTITLAATQFLFAVCVSAATMHRFLNLPWLGRADRTDFMHPERGGDRLAPRRFDRPERGMRAALPAQAAHAPVRVAVLLFFLICPLTVFSTISLTKSPLFAFAFLWAFGIWYELYATSGDRLAAAHGRAIGLDEASERSRGIAGIRARVLGRRIRGRENGPIRLPRGSFAAFVAANAVMLISAKYAWYVLAFEFVLALLADRRRWTTYVVALLLPTILIHGGITMAIRSGAIIGGDPIESRGVQLQMIARVAQRDPDSIPESARKQLAPVFNLDQMADAYFPQDADPVKSSGIQSKKVSYRWRSVKPEDMDGFNKAWLEIVKANPIVSIDALMAKCYGYFDIADQPYVSMSYYVDSDYVQVNSTWIKYYHHKWRTQVANFADSWSAIPVLGWVTHGNFYVIMTLLIGAAEVILRRWRALAWHLPLLLLMGVMITAPANNFERHMLPVAFCFGFLLLTFWRDSRSAAVPRD